MIPTRWDRIFALFLAVAVAVCDLYFLNGYLSTTPLAAATLSREGFLTAADHSTSKASSLEQPPRRKFYAIHIGPGKTGTSAIQTDLANNPFEKNTLAQDNVIYAGIKANPLDKYSLKEIRKINGASITPQDEYRAHDDAVACMGEVLNTYYYRGNNRGDSRNILNSLLETDEATRKFLKQTFIDECWEGYEYMLNASLVNSAEKHSHVGKNYALLGTRLRMFDILGYDRLLVVGAYRRYADWQVSTYVWSCSVVKACRTSPPWTPYRTIEMYLRDALRGETRTIFWNNLDVTLKEIREEGPTKLEVKILNYFQLPKTMPAAQQSAARTEGDNETFDSITTELYCDVFGMDLTPHTCMHARTAISSRPHNSRLAGTNNATSFSSSPTKQLFVRKGVPSNLVYQHIVAAGYRLGFLLPTDAELKEEEREKKLCKKIWCESLHRCLSSIECFRQTQNAAQIIPQNSTETLKVVGTNRSAAIRTYKDLSTYHTKVHNSTWIHSLPIVCPSEDFLAELLQRSLALEEQLMPDFYATPLGKAEHERLFWDVWLEKEKRFCWVDILRLFWNATTWEEIIDDRMLKHHWPQQQLLSPTSQYESITISRKPIIANLSR